MNTFSLLNPATELSKDRFNAQVVFKVQAILGYEENKMWGICYQAQKTATDRLYRVHESPNGTKQIVKLSRMIQRYSTYTLASLMGDVEMIFWRNI